MYVIKIILCMVAGGILLSINSRGGLGAFVGATIGLVLFGADK